MVTREKKKERIARRREEQILNAALTVFTKKGYGEATIPYIAQEAGVAVGTIYNYYPSKRELFVAVIKNFIITAPLMDLIDNLPKGDIAVTFKQILQNRFKLIESVPMSRLSFLMAEVQRDPELKALWAETYLQPFFSRLEAVVRDLSASGKYRHLEPVVTVRAVGGMILGFLMLKMMEGDTSPLNELPPDKVTDNLIDFVLHGLLDEREKGKS
ncbi:TetR/AcrR family transcriptional regulator [Chloroflexota bacterium]